MTRRVRWMCLAAVVTVGACGGSRSSTPASAPTGLSYPSPQTYTVGTAITPLTPTITGSVSSYSVSPPLPAGLTLNSSSGVIAGTPSAAAAMAVYTVTAQNAAGRTTFGLSITVNAQLQPPSGLSYPGPQTYTVGTAITPLTPTVTGSVSSYSVSPPLPAGLTLNSSSGVIAGTPSAAAATAVYTVTAQNAAGQTTFGLSITVNAQLQPPSELSYPSPQTYTVGTAIAPLTPTVTGSVSSYSVSPPLPAGLTLNSSSGVIAGTPSAAVAMAVYTVTAQNAAGQATFGLSIAVNASSATLLSGAISRTVIGGTSASVTLSIRLDSGPATLYANATDPAGVFRPTVAVTAGFAAQVAVRRSRTLRGAAASARAPVLESGSAPLSVRDYALELTTSAEASVGLHTGSVTLNLCEDAACTTPAAAPLAVPFSVNVMTPSSAWPGNNLTALSPWPGVPDWTTFQGNAGHTGYVPVTLNPDQFSTRWQRAATAPGGLGGAFYSVLNSVTTSGGQIFSAEGTKLLACAEWDGSVTWQYDFSTLAWPSTNPPAVGNGVVYMAAGHQSSTYFFAFDSGSGALLSKIPMTSQWEHYLAPTVGPSGVYTNAGTYGGVYGFTAGAASQLFFRALGQTSIWTPAVDAAGVYCYTVQDYNNGVLQVLDPLSGSVLHSIADPTFRDYVHEIDGSPVLGAPGSVFAANYGNWKLNGGTIGNTLLNFDIVSNTIRWQVAGDYASTPGYNAGILYAANANPVRLEARSETDGSLSWWWTPPQAGDTGFASEVLLTRNLVFVCTNLGLYAVDLNTHKTVWSYPIVGRLALSAQGVLYIAGPNSLTAINLK